MPLSDAFATPGGSPITYTSVTRRYTVGPTAEIGLPLTGFRIAADALYRRIGWDSYQPATPLNQAYQFWVRAGAWNFDLLLKKRFGGAGVHPYVAAGAAFQRLFTTRENFSSPGPVPAYVSKQ